MSTANFRGPTQGISTRPEHYRQFHELTCGTMILPRISLFFSAHSYIRTCLSSLGSAGGQSGGTDEHFDCIENGALLGPWSGAGQLWAQMELRKHVGSCNNMGILIFPHVSTSQNLVLRGQLGCELRCLLQARRGDACPDRAEEEKAKYALTNRQACLFLVLKHLSPSSHILFSSSLPSLLQSLQPDICSRGSFRRTLVCRLPSSLLWRPILCLSSRLRRTHLSICMHSQSSMCARHGSSARR
jgi:hypothetical protein